MNNDCEDLLYACLYAPFDAGVRMVLADALAADGWDDFRLSILRWDQGQWFVGEPLLAASKDVRWEFSITDFLRQTYTRDQVGLPDYSSLRNCSLMFKVGIRDKLTCDECPAQGGLRPDSRTGKWRCWRHGNHYPYGQDFSGTVQVSMMPWATAPMIQTTGTYYTILPTVVRNYHAIGTVSNFRVGETSVRVGESVGIDAEGRVIPWRDGANEVGVVVRVRDNGTADVRRT